jgi:deoxycytidine triphosphate deaminase
MIGVITLNRIDYKLPDLSSMDSIDIAIIKFIYEKFDGKAPLDELNAVTVMLALGPRWQESISMPLIKDMIPSNLLKALSSNLAERELFFRIEKLEQLGIIKVHGYSSTSNTQSLQGDQNRIVYLTKIGREIAEYNGILFQNDSLEDIVEKLSQLSTSLPIQEIYTINPRELYIVIPNEIIEVERNHVVLLKPIPNLASLGIRFLTETIIGPFKGVPKIIIMGGYIPITIKKDIQIGYIIRLT